MADRYVISSIVALGAVGAASAFSCAGEPPVHCTIADGALSAKFYLVAIDGGCAPSPGDVLGVTAYVPDPLNPGNGLSKLAIQSQTVGLLRQNGESANPPVVDTNPGDVAYALGSFATALPDSNGICAVPALAPAALSLGAVDDPDAGLEQPATDLRYEWSNVRVLVEASQIGVQMTGDLTLTQNGCSGTYHVAGLWPSVSCAALDDAGNALTDDAGNPVLDATQCSPDNGINPNVDVACDPVQALCVPTKEAPF